MFRKMRQLDEDLTITVTRHIILSNLWEIYVVADEEPSEDPDIIFTLTVGQFTELGYQSLKELNQYIISDTTDLHELVPAPGWTWVGAN
jgi:hypothetical protein